MREFFREIVRGLKNEQPVMLVSVIEAGGSTPRGAGAMMAVFPDGRSIGTVGGGNVEFAAQKKAAKLLESRESIVERFRFVPGDAASLGMVCGGDVTLHFQYLPAGDLDAVDCFRDIQTASAGTLNTWLVRKIVEGRVEAMGLADRNGLRGLPEGTVLPQGLLENQGVLKDEWFACPVVRGGRLYVFGGGHVAQALVPVAAGVGFRPVVSDDRPEFTDPKLFPGAEETFCGDFEHLEEKISVSPDDYVVIMTRGHQADNEVLMKVLRSGAKYIGCIGSRKKMAYCKGVLLEAGFTEEEYARIHTPIGLPIGAETPAEIAVCIVAELMSVRAGLDKR